MQTYMTNESTEILDLACRKENRRIHILHVTIKQLKCNPKIVMTIERPLPVATVMPA